MNILELFFEGWLNSTMKKHDRIQSGEDVKLAELHDQLKTLDQTTEDFEYRMESAAVEYEKWVKSKLK
ncbi:hypothetical protein [Metabacillus halosaccharovorans]|uniref:hypothetical protein n=1 Tax=Metabacillus halosaccharovorans TaxID=930124 RepID=UPI002041AB85|nr:hypothetical protein [Metabacillus halosaccharovorans]MCM3442351.1 hypothetical protein [Metabacillus halosaccharovorans]